MLSSLPSPVLGLLRPWNVIASYFRPPSSVLRLSTSVAKNLRLMFSYQQAGNNHPVIVFSFPNTYYLLPNPDKPEPNREKKVMESCSKGRGQRHPKQVKDLESR